MEYKTDWSEVVIKVPAARVETAAAIATMTVPYGIYIEDYSDMEELLPQIGRVDFVSDELLSKDKSAAKIHIYIPLNLGPGEAISFISERLESEGIEFEIEKSSISEEEWANSWKQFYKPRRIGERLVVCPSWESFEKSADDVVITVDPGSSFGTGEHETTSLCLQVLEELISGGERVLDMGCGSGILSVAALALGADSAVAVDIDENAVATARENARDNGFSGDSYTALSGDVAKDAELCRGIGEGFDVVCANIVADVIISMRELFFDKLRSDGTLIVSGIIDSRADEVKQTLEAAGFASRRTLSLKNWVAMVFYR